MQGAPDKQTHNASALMWSLMPGGASAQRRVLVYASKRFEEQRSRWAFITSLAYKSSIGISWSV